MFRAIFEAVRSTSPLIHNITNYVTVNDCANILIACGAAPIMADDREEAAQITAICAGLNINIGTLNSRTIESMYLAGKQANALGHPSMCWGPSLRTSPRSSRKAAPYAASSALSAA